MCEELNEELGEGSVLARELAEHFERMGAGRMEIPVETDNGCYIVSVRKTL